MLDSICEDPEKSKFAQSGLKGAGFKAAFYEYTEANEKSIGTQMNRIYSMSINIYRRLADLEMALKECFTDNYHAEIRQPNMLIVLVHDFIIENNKLKIGGMLSRMVKDNEAKLRLLLKSNKDDAVRDKLAHLPKYAYLRMNALYKKEDAEGSDSSEEEKKERIEEMRAQLKAEGYKVKRVQGMNILQVKNKKQPKPIAQHELVKTSQVILQDLSSCMPV